MLRMNRRFASLFVFIAVVSAFAQTPTSNFSGKWIGRMKFEPAKDPTGKSIPMQAPPATIAYFLSLSPNGKFHTDIKGTPDKKTHTSDGTWKFAAGKVTLFFEKRDGQPDNTEPRTRVLTLSKDGKSMTTVLEGQVTVNGPKGQKQLPKGFVAPKARLIFTRN